ncbi:MAG: YlxM family DNA-binding protein [bacterium]
MKDEQLAKKEHVILLMDCYKSLLTDKQAEYLELYYEEDWSLSEIADSLNVSRNAVFDNLKRAVKVMEKYEKKLGLLRKHEERLKLISAIKQAQEEKHEEIDEYLEMLKSI